MIAMILFVIGSVASASDDISAFVGDFRSVYCESSSQGPSFEPLTFRISRESADVLAVRDFRDPNESYPATWLFPGIGRKAIWEKDRFETGCSLTHTRTKFRKGTLRTVERHFGFLFCLGIPTLIVREERSLRWVGGELLFGIRNGGHRWSCRLERVQD